MLTDEVLIGELFAVDGFAARTLHEKPITGQQPDMIFRFSSSITMSDWRGNKNLRVSHVHYPW